LSPSFIVLLATPDDAADVAGLAGTPLFTMEKLLTPGAAGGTGRPVARSSRRIRR